MKQKNRFIDDVLLITHPLISPKLFLADGIIEVQEAKNFMPPLQSAFLDEIHRSLIEFFEVRKFEKIGLQSGFKIEPDLTSEYPICQFLRIIGIDESPDILRFSSEAAQFLLFQIFSQIPIENPSISIISADDQEILKSLAKAIRTKFARKNVTEAFVVRYGPSDSNVITVRGMFGEAAITERSDGTIRGVGIPVGFDAITNTVTLRSISSELDEPAGSNLSEMKKIPGKISGKCIDSNFLCTLAQAYLAGSKLTFTILAQSTSKTSAPTLTFTRLQELLSSDEKPFELESI